MLARAARDRSAWDIVFPPDGDPRRGCRPTHAEAVRAGQDGPEIAVRDPAGGLQVAVKGIQQQLLSGIEWAASLVGLLIGRSIGPQRRVQSEESQQGNV